MSNIIRSLRHLPVWRRNVNNLLEHRTYHQTTTSYHEADDESNSSRNEKKRVARRAVKLGMQLANFSTFQIKRILKVASLHRELLDAILLAKTLGREAKRRQFNLIGKFLREVDPELIDSLILATLEGDKKNFEKLFGLGSWDFIKEDDDDEQDTESEDDEQDMVKRWYDGLVNKDVSITNEVYSLHNVEFDRQELRSLVRRVHSVQGNQFSSEEKVEEVEAKHLRARKALTRFLRSIVKQIPED